MPCSGRFSFESLGARAVDGGHEDDGTPLAIARAHAKERSGLLGIGGGGASGLFPGKASPKLDGAYVTVGDKEVKVEVRQYHDVSNLDSPSSFIYPCFRNTKSLCTRKSNIQLIFVTMRIS